MKDTSKLICIRVSDSENATIQAAADARGLSLSAYVRMVALDCARRDDWLTDHYRARKEERK